MAPLRDLSDRDIDRLLAGRRAVHGEAHDLAELVREVRSEHLRPMAADVEERHVSAMAQAARDLASTEPSAVPAGEPARPRRASGRLLPANRLASAAAAIAAITVTAGLGTAGLAVAGVDLPDPARDVFRQVGVTLPNQDEPSEALRRSREARAAAVRAVIAATPPSEREGCGFAQRVAEAARGRALPAEAEEACAAQEARRAQREERQEQRNTPSAGTGVESTEDRGGSAAEQSDRARRQRPATPEGRKNFGRDTAEGARRRDPGTDAGGSPPASRPKRGGGDTPSSQGDRPGGAGTAPGARGGRPKGGTGQPKKGTDRSKGNGRSGGTGRSKDGDRSEGAGAPEGAGPPPGAGRGRPEGAGRP